MFLQWLRRAGKITRWIAIDAGGLYPGIGQKRGSEKASCTVTAIQNSRTASFDPYPVKYRVLMGGYGIKCLFATLVLPVRPVLRAEQRLYLCLLYPCE